MCHLNFLDQQIFTRNFEQSSDTVGRGSREIVRSKDVG